MAGGTKRQGRRGTSEQPANPDTPDVEDEQAPPTQPIERSGSNTPEDDGAQSPETETLQQKHARLTAAVAEKRMREEIEEMEREIAGEAPAPHLERGRGQKRIASDTAETSNPHKFYFRSKSPPTFEGKTLKEVSIFKTRWEIEFAAQPPMEERRQVAIAATGLRGTPLEAWGRKTEDIEEWDKFINWCRDLVKDPANRTMLAYLQLKDAKQRKNQSVRDFVNYIEEQEKHIPDNEDDTLRKAWFLLVSLDEEIRQGVMKENKTITSREQVIAAAQRQEELIRDARGRHRDTSRSPSRRDARPPRGRRGGAFSRTLATHTKEEKPPKDNTSAPRCYNCQKIGHIAANCPEGPRKERWSNTGEPPAQPKK